MRKGKNKQNQGNAYGEQKMETQNEEKNEDNNNGRTQNKEVVLKVYIHCEGCSTKVFNCLKGVDGVEDVVIDTANHKVIVKGRNNVDPMKVLERLQKKYSRNVELISPKPKTNNQDKKDPPQKKEEPKSKTMILKMFMHCETCAYEIQRNIGRMQGIMSVEPDMKKSLVVVRGVFDPPKLVEKITKRLGKHVEIVKHEEEKGKGKDQKKDTEEENRCSYPSQYHVKYNYPSLVFSDDNVFSCSIM